MYKRVHSLENLRAVVQAPESWELDFKTTVDPDAWWELSKDIAAFANHLGGVILVGVSEQEHRAQAFGIPATDVPRIAIAYENAARDKCLPRPLVTVARIQLPDVADRSVVAINVEAVPDQIVGAMFYAVNKQQARTTSEAWRFPVRVGKDNVLISPDRLPMFIDTKSRRTVIRLSSIPAGTTPSLVWRRPTNQTSENPVVEEVIVIAVDHPANVLRLRRVSTPEQQAFAIPLDDVDAVWEATENNWRIRVTGWLDGDKYVTNPSNAVFRR
jgi:hypothetical protein